MAARGTACGWCRRCSWWCCCSAPPRTATTGTTRAYRISSCAPRTTTCPLPPGPAATYRRSFPATELEPAPARPSDVDLGLEDRHGLAADPYRRRTRVRELQLHVDPARAVQRVALHPGEAGAIALAVQQPEVSEKPAEQAVRVTTHRILGDAERRAEHARLGEMISAGFQREHEITGGAELRRERGEAAHVGLEALECLG